MNYKKNGVSFLIALCIFSIGASTVFAQSDILRDEINQARKKGNFSEMKKRLQDKRPYIEITDEEKTELESLQRKYFLDRDNSKKDLGIRAKFLEDNSRLQNKKIQKNTLDDKDISQMKKYPREDLVVQQNQPKTTFFNRIRGFFSNVFK